MSVPKDFFEANNPAIKREGAPPKSPMASTSGVLETLSPATNSLCREQMPLSDLQLDPEIQRRGELNRKLIAEYAEMIVAWIDGSPIAVVRDGEVNCAVDGFRWVRAAQQAGLDAIPCMVTPGARRDAMLRACAANKSHRLRRTDGDKRRGVETMLADPQWTAWSDREIARWCAMRRDHFAPPSKWTKEYCKALEFEDGHEEVSAYCEDRPEYLKIGSSVRYLPEDVVRWLQEQAAASTSDPGLQGS